MGISTSDAIILAKTALAAQRLRIAAVETVGSQQIIRYSGANGAAIGSILINPVLREGNEAEATANITRLILESARAAVAEPGLKATAAAVIQEQGQPNQSDVFTVGKISAPASVAQVAQAEAPGGKLE